MWVYLLIFFTVFFLYANVKGKSGISVRTFTNIWICLAVFVGLADMLGGYDRYIYGELFDQVADRVQIGKGLKGTQIMKLYSKEFGFAYLNYAIAFITSNRYIFITCLTWIIYFLYYKAIRSEADNYGFVTLLFLGLFFFFTFTYLRQALAIGFAWFSYKYIVARDWKRYVLCIICATIFHNGALIFAPAYFLTIINFSRKHIIIVALLVLAIGLTGLPSSIYEIYGEATQMYRRAQRYVSDIDTFRIEYIIEAVVFLFYLLSAKTQAYSTRERLHYNIALVFCGILLLFCKSENGGRLSWPFMLGLICALSTISSKSGKLSFKSVSLIVLSFLLYIRILLAWEIFLYPYKTYLTDGYRADDWIHQSYEYDSRYDKDKFYR